MRGGTALTGEVLLVFDAEKYGVTDVWFRHWVPLALFVTLSLALDPQ